MQRCQDSCRKLKKNAGSSPEIKSQSDTDDEHTEDLNDSPKNSVKSVVSNRPSPPRIQKSVQIARTTPVEEKNSRNHDKVASPQRSTRPMKSNGMSARGENPSKKVKNADQWNSTGHNPCDSNCPMAKARDRAISKAEMRQERLDEYLLTKGFSYFDDLCTCSSICLFSQLRRDKFVVDILKSAFLFTLGIKLCDELDAWNLIG